MLSKEEEVFIQYWEAAKQSPRKSKKHFYIGFTVGLCITGLVLFLTLSGWYQRANMVASTRLNPLIFLIVGLIIAFFMGFIYERYMNEQQEQRYLELIARQNKLKQKAATSSNAE